MSFVQVVGKLPFEDANHKKLLKLILGGPVFPAGREGSLEFRDVVLLILKLEDIRIGIPQIRKTDWYKIYSS